MSIKNNSRNGFTLVELLVAIGIVAVITAILFPVFASVRERGRRTVCQSNLKQIAIAMQQYVQDNNGTYPVYVRYDGPRCYAAWIPAVSPYVKDYHLFRCPDHPHGNPEGADTDVDHLPQADMDYVYDVAGLNGASPAPSGALNLRGKRESSLAAASTAWLNAEAAWIDGDGVNHYFRNVSTSCGQDFSGSTLHSGAGNYSYIDGHVKWLTPEEAGEIECTNGPLPVPFKD